MPRFYQRKYCIDGSVNPQFKPRRTTEIIERAPKPHAPRFVAWDGEGITDARGHHYVLLRNSEGARVENPHGLSTIDCLETILNARLQFPKALHIGFGFGYDTNMIVRDLPRARLKELWKAGKTTWQGYLLRYRHRKEFSVRDLDSKRTVRIWDCLGFFQLSFVEALRKYKLCSESQIAEIERMKGERGAFHERDLDSMATYCLDECILLAQLMERFESDLKEAEIKVTRWDGAAAISAALFRKYELDRFRYPELPSLNVTLTAQAAYYGGRIELLKFGHAESKVYQYDIRSAYPHALTEAPCLAHGEWTCDNKIDSDFCVGFVAWDFGNAPAYPLPWRCRDGGVYFPARGCGWYFAPEIFAAQQAARAFGGAVQIKKVWNFHRHCEHRPFSWISEIFDTRARWKAEGRGAEKVLKLGLNGAYGKCAQRAGAKIKPPKWHQIEWAAFATSFVRARLYLASLDALQKGQVISYATDALLSLAPLDKLTLTERLGDWELTEHANITAIQSGVYWLGDDVAHTRGFERSDLARADVVRAYARGTPALEIHGRRFIGMGKALASKSMESWRTWKPETRVLQLLPTGTKRELVSRPRKNQLIDSVPADPNYWRQRSAISTPLAFPWNVAYLSGSKFDPATLGHLLNIDDESDAGND